MFVCRRTVSLSGKAEVNGIEVEFEALEENGEWKVVADKL